MNPINKNVAGYENSAFDTDFNSGTDIIEAGDFVGKKYQVAAIGKPIHGLNINGVLENTNDFSSPVIYTGVTYSTIIHGITKKAWRGDKYVNYSQKFLTEQISAFRCGDCNTIRVPDFQAVRNESTLDVERNLKWKDYALICSREQYAFGYALGADSWLCTFGVGRTYRIKFLSSTGSGSVTRKFNFTVYKFGRFGDDHLTAYNVSIDTGIKDYLRSSVNSILPGEIVSNLRGNEQWRVGDYTSNGQKVLIQAYIPSNIGIEDDGVNDVCSAPLAWLEFTFSESADELNVAYIVKGNFSENLVNSIKTIKADFNLFKTSGRSTFGTAFSGSSTIVDPQNYTESYAPVVFSGVQYNSYIGSIEPISGNPIGNRISTIASTNGEIGKFWGSSGGVAIRQTRIIHMCYDNTDSITTASARYTRESITNARRLGDFSISSSYTKTVTRGVVTISGTAVATRTQETIASLKITLFELLVNDTSIDSFRVDISTDSTSVTTSTTIAAPESPIEPPTSVTSNPVSSVNVTPPINVGPISVGGGYDIICGWQALVPFRDIGIEPEEPGAWIMPFYRIDSNKIVSFNIARDGYSAVIETYPAGNNDQFPLRSPALVAGNHFLRTVYDMYNNRLLVNTSAYGNNENPAVDIPGGNYFCTLNTATGEAVLNGAQMCAWI